MTKRYRKESRAFRHVEILQRELGCWPGVVTKYDDNGNPYYVLTYDPPIWGYQL